MSQFIPKPSRSIELPLGCKDLIDVDAVRNWQPFARPNWPTRLVDQLAYMEGQLGGLLESAGKSVLVGTSRFQGQGSVMIIPDADLGMRVMFGFWYNVAQAKGVRAVFQEAGVQRLTGPVGRWKAKRSLKCVLSPHPVVAARFVSELFRVAYGLGDLARVTLWYHEPKAASKDPK